VTAAPPVVSKELGPIATITIAIVGGLIAFGTDVFKSSVFALRSERDLLSQSVKDLSAAKAKLSADNASEVFDLKPTSPSASFVVESGNGDDSRTFGRARHTRSGVP